MTVGALDQALAGLEIETITSNIYCLHAQIQDLELCACVCVCLCVCRVLPCIREFSTNQRVKKIFLFFIVRSPHHHF